MIKEEYTYTIAFKMDDGNIIQSIDCFTTSKLIPRIGEHFIINDYRCEGKHPYKIGNLCDWDYFIENMPQCDDKNYIDDLMKDLPIGYEFTKEEIENVTNIFEKHFDLRKFCKVCDVVRSMTITETYELHELDFCVVLEKDSEWFDKYIIKRNGKFYWLK